MPQFSNTSRERLLSCDSRLIAVCSDAIAFFDFTVVCGHRTDEEQDLLFAQGRIMDGPIVTYKRGGESIHNTMPSRAIDLAPWVPGHGIAWDDEVLTLEFDDLTKVGFEMPALGWSPEEAEAITGKFNVEPGHMPDLSAKSSPFTQATLTMTHTQMATMREALDVSKGNGDFGDTGNPNSNGNAIARICAEYCER